MNPSLASLLALVLTIPAAAADLDLVVVDGDGGKPVIGASIAARVGGPTPGPTSRGTTDDQGHCAIPVPPEARSSHHFAVHVWKDGFVPIRVLWGDNPEFEFEGVPASYKVVLDRGTTIGGTIRDAQGRPVAGARVHPEFSGLRSPIEGIELAGEAFVTTDENGCWRCAMLPSWFADERMAVIVGHPRYIISNRSGDRAIPLAELRSQTAVTVLETGYDVSGAVTDLKGRPIAGAEVVWQEPHTDIPGIQGGEEGNPGEVRVKTGPDGRFRLENLPPGMHWIRAAAPGLAARRQPIRLGPPEPQPLRERTPAMPGSPSVEYELREPPAPTQRAKDGPCDPPLVFRLEPGRTIAGRVVGADGRPVAGAVVMPAPLPMPPDQAARVPVDLAAYPAPPEPPFPIPHSWMTDADGRFRCDGMPRGFNALDVSDPSEHTSIVRPLGPDDGREIVVKMPPPFRLRGKVVDAETGRPIERFQLIEGDVSTNAPPDDDAPPAWFRARRRSIAGPTYEVRFPESFMFGAEDYTRLVIRIEAEGYAPWTSRKIHHANGVHTWAVALHKQPWITGTVRASDGSPAAGAEIALAIKGRPVPRVDNGRFENDWTTDVIRTGPEGRYALPRPETNGRVVIVDARGLAQRTVEELAADPNVTLEPWATIDGEVRVGRGIGARRLMSAISYEPDSRGEPFVSFSARTLSGVDGHFVLDRVPPGHAIAYRPHRLSDGKSLRSHRQGIDVGAGQTVGVIVGGAGRPVVGRVTAAAGLPAFDLCEVSGRLRRRQASPGYPEGFDEWDDDRRQRWWQAFYATAEGRAYYEQGSAYAVEVESDGSFRIDDVPGGHYWLTLEYQRNGLLLEDPESIGIVAAVKTEIDVPAGPDDAPTDIGTLTLSSSDR